MKNLSPDKIKLSVFRGEGDLTNLELDEEALMELLELPTWLCIRKVTCNKVAIKVSHLSLDLHTCFPRFDFCMFDRYSFRFNGLV